MRGKSRIAEAMMRQVMSGGHAGGRTARMEAEIREQLAAGVPIGRWTADGFVMLSLDADGQIVNGEPPPPVDPNLWRFDATTGAYINVADPEKRVQMWVDELQDLELQDFKGTGWFRSLFMGDWTPCDTDAQEAASGVEQGKRRR